MNSYSLRFALVLVACLALTGAAFAEASYPPGPKPRSESSYWTTKSKACDNVWIDMSAAIAAAKLDAAVMEKVNVVLRNGDATRTKSIFDLSRAASAYFCATRGKDVFDRYEKYGSTIKLQDVPNMQAGLDIYCGVSSKLAKGEIDTLEAYISDAMPRFLYLNSLRSKLSPEITERYLSLATTISAGLLELVKIGPDAAALRKAWVEISKSAVAFAGEFYGASPSSCDYYVFKDAQGREWFQFDSAPVNPFVDAATKIENTRVEPDVDKKKVATLLEALDEADLAYMDATGEAVANVIPLLPADLGKKVREIVMKLGELLPPPHKG
ncbi:MAG: hypothetical protein WC712_02615 [Candidatus Brocadiia bacterium]